MTGKIIAVIGAVYFMLFCFPGLARAADREVTAVRAAKPLQIDGRLSEDDWNKAEWHSDFSAFNSTNPAREQTRFAVLYDDNNLYVGVRCSESDMEHIKAEEKEREGMVWKDDCVEIFLNLVTVDEFTYHFVVNSLGTQYDAMRLSNMDPSLENTRWDGLWKSVAFREKDAWTLEVAIPWYTFETHGKLPLGFNIQVARERYAGNKEELRELSSFPGARIGFGFFSDMAKLTGIKVDLSKFGYSFSSVKSTTQPQGENLEVKLQFEVLNDTGSAASLHVEGWLSDKAGKIYTANKELALADKEKKEIELVYLVKSPGEYNFQTILQQAGAIPRNTVGYNSAKLTLEYIPLKVKLLEPCYRESFYATQESDKIRLKVKAQIPSRGADKNKMIVKLTSEKDDKPVASKEISSIPKEEQEIALTGLNLSVGNYVLTIDMTDSEGKTTNYYKETIRKLPPAPGSEVRPDEKGVTLVNGKPLFPYGIWSMEYVEDFPIWNKVGLNATGCYNFYRWPDTRKKEFLDNAHSNGFMIITYPYPDVENYLTRPANKISLTAEEKQKLTDFVNKWKNHPAILAWFMNDEPECSGVPAKYAKELYEIVRGADPYHPCLMLNDSPEGVETYCEGADILMPDPYVTYTEKGPVSPLRPKIFLEEIERLGKPAWVVPQAFAYFNCGGNKKERYDIEPNHKQVRWQAYVCLIHNVNAIIWYSFATSKYDNGRVRAFLFYEYEELSHAMYYGLAPELKIMISYVIQGNPGVKVATDRKDVTEGKLYTVPDGKLLIVVSLTDKKLNDVKIKLPEMKDTVWNVIAEDRKINSEKNTITDNFEPYDTHVYATFPVNGIKSLEEISKAFKSGERIKRP